LIGIELDTRSKWRLKQPRIGRSDAIPSKRIQVCREYFGVIKPAGCDRVPGFSGKNFRIELAFPENFELPALVVIVDTRKPD
jgi:hypothetical protein